MWTSDINLLKEHVSEKYLVWLEKPYNLSVALQRVCDTLRVQVLYQGESVFSKDERDFLKEPSSEKHCYVRKVFLKGDDTPFCLACITVPLRTYQQYSQEFLELNGQLLGNTLLYSNKKTTRSHFQYGLVESGDTNNSLLFKGLAAYLLRAGCFPARRSIFYMDGEFPILVTEVFLEKIPLYRE